MKNERKWVEKERKKCEPQRTTSILPQLRHYRRLTIFAIFAAAGSLESVWKPQLRQYAGTLPAIAGQNFRKENKGYFDKNSELTIFFDQLFYGS